MIQVHNNRSRLRQTMDRFQAIVMKRNACWCAMVRLTKKPCPYRQVGPDYEKECRYAYRFLS